MVEANPISFSESSKLAPITKHESKGDLHGAIQKKKRGRGQHCWEILRNLSLNSLSEIHRSPITDNNPQPLREIPDIIARQVFPTQPMSQMVKKHERFMLDAIGKTTDLNLAPIKKLL